MNTVKHLLLTAVAVAWAGTAAWGQTPAKVKYRFIEAADLGVLGHISQTQNPYHRVDTTVYKGWTAWQNNQVRCSSGLSVAFRTNSTVLTVKTQYGFLYTGTTTNVVAHKGYDLYIKKDGRWLYAESAVEDAGKPGSNVVIIKNMSNEMKECLLYLPLYSEEYSIQLGVEEGAVIEPIPAPFRHRIGIYGSSYTHGVSCGRAGMTYPAQFTRATGIQLLSLGMSGQCKMQPYA
ncbi:MAG: SGNH/GDSL hydrolase family protein, partial [Bacteroidales bacterium]|nr:SGNH/GDSL hydrolase family protein [Bacteroidales bacterium]